MFLRLSLVSLLFLAGCDSDDDGLLADIFSDGTSVTDTAITAAAAAITDTSMPTQYQVEVPTPIVFPTATPTVTQYDY